MSGTSARPASPISTATAISTPSSGRPGHHDYFQNTGTAIAPVFAERTGAANPFNGVDFRYRSTPSFADLDGDGDLDAIVGDNNGTLHYFQNTGTATAPVFAERTGAANPFNGVDVGTTARRASPTSTATATSTPSSATSTAPCAISRTPVRPPRRSSPSDRRRQSLRRRRCRFPHHADLRRPRRRRRPRRHRRGAQRHPALFREHRFGHHARLHLAHRRRQSFNGADVGRQHTSFADLDGDGDALRDLRHSALFHDTGAGFTQVVNVTAENDAATFPPTCAI